MALELGVAVVLRLELLRVVVFFFVLVVDDLVVVLPVEVADLLDLRVVAVDSLVANSSSAIASVSPSTD